MHRHHGAGVLEVEQKSRSDTASSEFSITPASEKPRGHAPVERIGGPGERRGAQGQKVRSIEGGGEPGEVAAEHPYIGEQVMREEHRLRVLQVRHARQHRVARLLSGIEQRRTEPQIRLHEVLGERLRSETRVGGNLVVSRPTGVQPSARRTDAPRELAFDRHVNVLVGDIKDERTRIDIRLNGLKPLADGIGVFLADDALRREHRRVRNRTSDILLIQRLIYRQRRTEFLRHRGGSLLESAAPQRHVPTSESTSRPAALRAHAGRAPVSTP